MNIPEILNKLQIEALHNEQLRERFLATRKEPLPLNAFCELSRELGYEIYPMDIIAANEESYAAMKRSTNGGGENSPVLEGEDDYYEDFFGPLFRDRKEMLCRQDL